MAQTVKLTSTAPTLAAASQEDRQAVAHGAAATEGEVGRANRDGVAQTGTEAGGVASPYEVVLAGGFRYLRFPWRMEARYRREKAEEHGYLQRMTLAAAAALVMGMLVSDWMMVPDMLPVAWQLRLFLYVVPVVLWLMLFDHVSVAWREWFGVLTALPAAGIPAWLAVRSTDELGPAYLVSLALILLFNSGVMRMRFWNALVADTGVMLIFIVAMAQLDPLPQVLMLAISLILISSFLFMLHGSYCLEHEERTNWLMLQHEQLLLAEIERGNRRLDQLSRHDPLTGLANRRHVDEFLQQVWDRARGDGEEVSLLMMDIDHFKAFNDHYGHPEGDACLKDVAEAMGTHLRQPGDLVGRFGGEEFIAVFNRAGLEAAQVAAERVRQGVRQLARRHEASGTAAVVTVSIGAACVRPGRHERSPERLIALADRALYQAKSGGRDRVAALSEQD